MLGIFLDTETNGLNAQVHKIIELAYKIVDLSTGEIKETFQSIISYPEEIWKQSDLNSLKVNGFTWEEIQTGKNPPEIAIEVIQAFNKWGIRKKQAIFICQNPSFDRTFFAQLIDATKQEELGWPYHWLDLASMFWAQVMSQAKQNQGQLPWEIGCSKDQIATYYHLPTEASPHRAMNGVEHLCLCYQAIVGFPKNQSNKGIYEL